MEINESDSILLSISKMVDVTDLDTFKTDLLTTINMCFAFCNQYGCGPDDGFEITGESETWADYECKSITHKNMAKGYIFTKTKLTFDPPQSGPMLTALQKQLDEYAWYITNCR